MSSPCVGRWVNQNIEIEEMTFNRKRTKRGSGKRTNERTKKSSKMCTTHKRTICRYVSSSLYSSTTFDRFDVCVDVQSLYISAGLCVYVVWCVCMCVTLSILILARECSSQNAIKWDVSFRVNLNTEISLIVQFTDIGFCDRTPLDL